MIKPVAKAELLRILERALAEKALRAEVLQLPLRARCTPTASRASWASRRPCRRSTAWSPPWRPSSALGAAHGADRNRQGAPRPRHPPAGATGTAAPSWRLNCAALPDSPARERALRPRTRGIHRAPSRQHRGRFRAGRWGHAPTRRDRGDPPLHPGQAPAGAAERGAAAAGKPGDHAGRRAGDRVDQSGPAAGGARGGGIGRTSTIA